MKRPAVYILASKRNGTLYIGVTSNLAERVQQHKPDAAEGFTKTHSMHTLVYYELHDDMCTALEREKHLKRWNRAWKLRLIEKENPTWKELAVEI